MDLISTLPTAWGVEPVGTHYRSDRMGYKCDIAPLDLRDGGPTTLIHMDGHRGPAPLEPAAGVSRPLHVRGPGWDRWSDSGVYTSLD